MSTASTIQVYEVYRGSEKGGGWYLRPAVNDSHLGLVPEPAEIRTVNGQAECTKLINQLGYIQAARFACNYRYSCQL